MAYIGKEPVVGNFQVCDAITVVNGQAAYSLTVGSAAVNPESANHMLVSLNGILQKPGSSFTISGSTITFASNLVTNDVIDFIQILGNVLDLGQPSDDTVKTASLQANAVTGAKLNTDTISAQTALAAEPADTDEFLVSDGGVLKRIDYSLIKGGGGLVHIKTQTASDVSSVDFAHGTGDVILDSTYDKYLFSCDYKPANDNVTPQLFISVDAGSSFITANYVYGMDGFEAGGSAITRQSGSDSQIELSPDTQGGAADEMMSYNIYLSMPARANTHKLFTFVGTTMDAASNLSPCSGAGACTGSTAAVDGVRFKFSAGNIEFGTFSLFGVSKC